MTMLFGSFVLAWPLTAAGVAGLFAPTWVFLFERLLAMAMSDEEGGDGGRLCRMKLRDQLTFATIPARQKFRWGKAYRACPTLR